jgi:hypothetical protein
LTTQSGPIAVPKFIISYRRSDSDVFAGRIRDRLATRFGEDSVFIDVDNIPFGKDFRVHIQEALAEADAVLVVIGPKWLGGGKGGHSRIKDDSDPVRIEVETALNNRLPTVPILVGQTSMPKPEQLPQSLRNFAFINAAPVDTGRDFHRDLARVITTLETMIASRKDVATKQAGDKYSPIADPGEQEALGPYGQAPSSKVSQPRRLGFEARPAWASSRSALLLPASLVALVIFGTLAGWIIIAPRMQAPAPPSPDQATGTLVSQSTPPRPLGDAPVPHVLPPAVSGNPIQAVIDARQAWQKSSLIVQGSGTIAFRATGTWIFNPAMPAVDGNGDVRFSTEGRPTYAFSGPGGREGQLIGRIGTGTPFIVGTMSSHFIAAGESGPVYLVINDDLAGGTGGAGLNDNGGSLTVTLQQLAQ